MANKKYKVTYEYRGRVTVEVEAPDSDAAEEMGVSMAMEADALFSDIQFNKATAREVKS